MAYSPLQGAPRGSVGRRVNNQSRDGSCRSSSHGKKIRFSVNNFSSLSATVGCLLVLSELPRMTKLRCHFHFSPLWSSVNSHWKVGAGWGGGLWSRKLTNHWHRSRSCLLHLEF